MMPNKKAFTLIELLIVIAIIGLLVAAIIANMNDVNLKARDAAIIQSANYLMKGAQIDSLHSGNYSAWSGIMPRAGIPNDCNFRYAGTSQQTNAIAACKNIVSNVGNYSGPVLSRGIMWENNHGNTAYPKLSIVVWLPGAKKYYCIASNGNSSTAMLYDGTGCSAGLGSCPGCDYDTSSPGN